MLTDFWDALSHLKNEKTMLKISQAPEYQKLVAFINQFLEINDVEKTKQYINYLIKDLKIFSLIAPADRNSAKKVNEMIKNKSVKKIQTEEKLSKKNKTDV